MPPETDIEHRLDEIEEKVEESNRILRSIKRKQTFDFWLGIVKALVLVGAFYYAYVYLEPYVDRAREFYTNVQSLSDSAGSFRENFLDYFRRGSEAQ